MGYCRQSKAYRVLQEATGKVIIRLDVIFDENDFDESGCESTQQSEENTREVDISIEYDGNTRTETTAAAPR